jgi:molybdate transport system regulatory protein
LYNYIGKFTISMAARPSPASIRLNLREGVAFGPGKAQLLEGIRETGSIAAAGRRMKMSYSRAWGLVEEMNSAFRGPLVASAKGGASHGGATLTPLGARVLEHYRRIEAAVTTAAAEDLAALRKSAGG